MHGDRRVTLLHALGYVCVLLGAVLLIGLLITRGDR